MTTHADLESRGKKIDCLCKSAQPGDLYTWVPVHEVTSIYFSNSSVDCHKCIAIADKMLYGVSLADARSALAKVAAQD